MKNYEKYNIDSLGINRCSRMYEKIFEKNCDCDGLECGDCPLESLEKFYKWSQEEYFEPPKLTHDEYVILKNLDSKWKWIVRHDNGKNLWLFVNRPTKEGYCIWVDLEEYDDEQFDLFNRLFQFIKWEDEEPYSIQQLIEDYEKEYGYVSK